MTATAQGHHLLILTGLWLASGLIGYACGRGRGRGAAGFLLGLCLGPFGWMLALFLPAASRRWRRRYR